MNRRQVISNLIVVTALICAAGTDYVANPVSAVNADRVVNIADRMAARLSRAFAHKIDRPAARYPQSRQLAMQAAIPQSPIPQWVVVTRYDLPQLLYLPPPALL